MNYSQRNFWIHSIEGGVYMGGMAFLSAESVLPAMIHSLGGPPWMVSLMPVLLVVGFFAPGIFLAPLVDRMPKLFRFVMICGIIQRLPYLIAAVALWKLTSAPAWLILGIAFSATLFSGFTGGVGATAWMEMVTRMVPEKHRATAWAIRNLVRAVIGTGAGFAVHAILERWPGQPGYAVLHLIAFGFLMVSYIVMSFLRETPETPNSAGKKTQYWREISEFPKLLLAKTQIRRYARIRILGPAFMIMAPFMAIHVLEVTGRPERALGYLVVANLTGNLLGNFIAAFLGRHWGGKSVMILGRIVQLVLCIQIFCTASFYGFWFSFFLFGFAYTMEFVGDLTLSVEICPRERRPFYISGLNFAAAIGLLLCITTGAVIEYISESFYPAIITSACSAVLSMILLLRIREPRTPRSS